MSHGLHRCTSVLSTGGTIHTLYLEKESEACAACVGLMVGVRNSIRHSKGGIVYWWVSLFIALPREQYHSATRISRSLFIKTWLLSFRNANRAPFAWLQAGAFSVSYILKEYCKRSDCHCSADFLLYMAQSEFRMGTFTMYDMHSVHATHCIEQLQILY